MISEIAPNIKNPTMISAGAVANDGIAVKSGANNVEIRNKNPETTAVKPVRPPAATPEEAVSYTHLTLPTNSLV